MNNRLDPVIFQKQSEIKALYQLISHNPSHPIAKLLNGDIEHKATKSFRTALQQPGLGVIAEIKRKSPSKGNLAKIKDPVKLSYTYHQAGANAISILTDEIFFGGNLNDLSLVAAALSNSSIPLLRKDFIINPIQIAEAVLAGADAILAIVAILGQGTQYIINSAREFGLDVLVEVHDETELKIALDCGSEIIGINNRNLKTFSVDTETALKLINLIPKEIVKVAESGLSHSELANTYYHAGFDAVLIGEALVCSNDPGNFIQECKCV